MKVQTLITLIVVSSYLVKSAAKIIGGILMSIPVLVADGIHGLFDIVEHGFLVIGGYFARKQNKEKYPLDRQPLIDLLGLVVYAGLIFFGVTLIIESFKLTINSISILNWITFDIPEWVLSNENKSLEIPREFLLIASGIMFISYIISEIVYKFEYNTAHKHQLREMIADAKELRSDGWLELGTSLSLFFAWLITIVLTKNYEDGHIHGITSLINAIILLFLGLYLIIFVAWVEFWEHFNNLMNKALDNSTRLKLENSISKRLPKSCKLITPLVCYHRGDQLFVKGHMSVGIEMMKSVDLIINNSEIITKNFFSNTDMEVITQFSPFFELRKDTISNDLNEVLSGVFGIHLQSPVSEAYRLMKHGQLDDAINWISNNKIKDAKEVVLSRYILAECYFRKNGAHDDKTKSSVKEIYKIAEFEQDITLVGLLLAWILIYKSTVNADSHNLQDEIYSLMDKLNKVIESERHLPDYILAEIFFALGFGWERCIDYDLEKCRKFYHKAEYHYLKSGVRSEIDRLYNTWGHFETLTFSLGDAEIHLSVAKKIREVKNDKLGLSYTYGCLGDLYGRLGRFQDSSDYYLKDINILEELKIGYMAPPVRVKMAEQNIRQGLLNKDESLVKKGMDLCYDTEKHLNNPFFAFKGIVKALLGLSEICHQGYYDYRTEAHINLDKMHATSTYHKSFLFRLKGRYCGIIGDYTEAEKLLLESKELFSNMKDPINEIHIGIQSAICDLEIYKWRLMKSNEIDGNGEKHAINQLKEYIESAGGMLLDSMGKLLEYIEQLESNKNKSIKIEAMNNIIWFLEG